MDQQIQIGLANEGYLTKYGLFSLNNILRSVKDCGVFKDLIFDRTAMRSGSWDLLKAA